MMNHLRVKSKKENTGGTCASAVGFLAHAGGEFATAPLHPLSKPYYEALGYDAPQRKEWA